MNSPSLPQEAGSARRLWWWVLLPVVAFLVAHELHSRRLNEAAAAFDRGEVANRNTDYRQAIVEFNEAIRLGEEGVLGHQGLAHYELGEDDRAIADFDEAIRLDPEVSWVHYDRGLAYQRQGDYGRATKDYSEAIRLNPKNTKAYAARSNVYIHGEYYDEAIADSNEAIRLDPTYARAYSDRGIAYRDKGDVDHAIADFDEAIRLDPKDAPAHEHRGFTYFMTGDHDRAIADFTESIRSNPKGVYPYTYRASERQSQGDFEGAIGDYSQSIALAPTTADYARFYLALTLRRLHRDDAPAGLAKAVAGWKTGWIKDIGRYLSGDLPEADFLTEAGKGYAKAVPGQQCEADYFAAMIHLISGDATGARSFFTQCLDTKMTKYVEFNLARAELTRLARE